MGTYNSIDEENLENWAEDQIENDQDQLKDAIKKNESDESEYEYDNEEDDDSVGSSPDRESDCGLFIKRKGIVPKGKDKHGSKAKEMLSFIAYPTAIESACKLVSQNKNYTLSEE